MSTWVAAVTIVLFSQLVVGEFGEKLTSNRTDTSSSSEEFYDNSSEEKSGTTSDDGVVIEKAILAAEITPKASFNLVDTPRGTKDRSSSIEIYNEKHKESPRYSGLDASSSENPVSSSYESTTFNNGYFSSLKINSSTDKGNSTHKEFSYIPPSGWSLFGYSPISQFEQKYSSTYRSTGESEINPPKMAEFQNNVIDQSTISHYDITKNSGNQDSGYHGKYKYSLNSFNPEASPEFISQTEEKNLNLEQNHNSQIEAAKRYLKQVEEAKEYASRVQALQDALNERLQSSALSQTSRWSDDSANEFYLQSAKPEYSAKSAVIPRTQAPGLFVIGSQSFQDREPNYATQLALTNAGQVNALAGDGWRIASSKTGKIPEANFYSGPTAKPVVLPSGFLADTNEVTNARIAHLNILRERIESTPLWKSSLPGHKN